MVDLGESEIEVVLLNLDGDVASLMRASLVNTIWNRVSCLPVLWSRVRWPPALPITDAPLLRLLALSADSIVYFDLSVPSDGDDPESMLRSPSALCWEWSLEGLRSGLSPETISHIIGTSAPGLRDIRFSWGGISGSHVLSSLTTCARLTRLDLANSSLENEHLSSLSAVLKKTPMLTHLDLCANELSQAHTLPLDLCSQLRWLGLCMNGLSLAPASLAALTSLTLLLLGGNALEEVPAFLRQLRNLVELDLGSNQIYHIPPWITQLSALRVLGLRSASLRHAPPNNPATDAHSVFPDLSCLPLRELDLSDCDLRDGPSVSWLAHIHTLESLDLSDNHLHSLPGASYPPIKKKKRLCS